MKKKINRRTFLKVMGAAALADSAGGLSGCGSTGENGEKSTIIRVAFNQPETHAEYIALPISVRNSPLLPMAAIRWKFTPTQFWVIRAP